VKLDDRKRRILQAIIDDYINTAEPIGSRTIARKHELGLSSATIRNEMADLEEMGYLAQPHTSAGRVPSDKGYRLYVDELMNIRELTTEEIESIKEAMEIRIGELSQLIRQASAVMSRFTRYTSMAITPQVKKSVLKAIQVVPISDGNAMVVVVTNTGVVRNSMVKIPKNLQPDYIIRVSNVLNEKLGALSIEKMEPEVAREIENEIFIARETLVPILNGIKDCINMIDDSEIYLEGATNIFNFPEFRDMVRAKEFLNTLDEKDIICRLLNYSAARKDVNIQIGTENEIDELKDCSLITATYSVGDEIIGSIGIIGPTRMEYPKVISSINFFRRKINHEIAKLLGEQD
jgi:heat-inducible transcriptional repressor